jgi:hypothetical protein
MARRPSRFHATCLGLVGALGGLLLLSPGCNDASDSSGEVAAPGGEGPAAGTSGSNSASGSSNSGASDAGGASSGATNAGGAAAEPGGAPAGGSDGEPTPSAGTGSGGDDGGPVGGEGGSTSGGAECQTADDCLVFNDCCSCEAIPKTQQRGECEKLCVQSACSAQGLNGVTATCRANRCVFDLSCDRDLVTCKLEPPTCDEGKVPSVEGACYGPCIAPEECSAVTDCKDCAAGQVCVTDGSIGGVFDNCVEVSSACAASPTCECTDACDFQCNDADGIDCYCLACN